LGGPLPSSEGVEGGTIRLHYLLWRLLVSSTLESGEDLGLKLGVTLHVQERAVLQHL
jgi:hypothetical protein